MGKVIWSMWARFMGAAAAICLVGGGAEAFIYPSIPLALGALGAGLLVGLVELPMPGLEYLSPISTSLYLRGFFYLALSGPFYISVPTTTGALCLTLTAVIYLIGAFRGEKWTHPREWGKDTRPRRAQQPKLSEVVVGTPHSKGIAPTGSKEILQTRMLSPNKDSPLRTAMTANQPQGRTMLTSRPRLHAGGSNVSRSNSAASSLPRQPTQAMVSPVGAQSRSLERRLPSPTGRNRMSPLGTGPARSSPTPQPATTGRGQPSLYFSGSQRADSEDADFMTLYEASRMQSMAFFEETGVDEAVAPTRMEYM